MRGVVDAVVPDGDVPVEHFEARGGAVDVAKVIWVIEAVAKE